MWNPTFSIVICTVENVKILEYKFYRFFIVFYRFFSKGGVLLLREGRGNGRGGGNGRGREGKGEGGREGKGTGGKVKGEEGRGGKGVGTPPPRKNPG